MSAEVLKFDVFAESGRGLMARVILPDNTIAYLADIGAITYEVHDKTAGGSPVTGSLVVADVMFAALQLDWDKDKIGYTFLWPADGALWPVANHRYRVPIEFTIAKAGILNGKKFLLVYEPNTKDPAA
jgi:hypothetical protein